MSQQEPPDRVAPSQDQLNGWKEIAAHLGKSARTVQRWEREYGLPVRRIEASGGEVVFAFRSEIDQWRLSEKASGPSREPAAREQERPSDGSDSTASGTRPGPKRRHWARQVMPIGLGVGAVVILLPIYAWLGTEPVLRLDPPLTRSQGQTYQFRGEGFTATGKVTRWTRVPNGNEEAMSSPLFAGADGSVRWALTTDCRTETGTHVLWMVDEATKQKTEAVSVVVLGNPECDNPAADLVSRDVSVDRTSARPGEAVTLTFSLWNIGTAPAVSTTTRVRLGSQSTRTGPGDRALGDYPTPAIPIGESRVQQVKVAIPAGIQPGVYYLWVVADNGSAIIERNSYNNFARSEALAVLAR